MATSSYQVTPPENSLLADPRSGRSGYAVSSASIRHQVSTLRKKPHRLVHWYTQWQTRRTISCTPVTCQRKIRQSILQLEMRWRHTSLNKEMSFMREQDLIIIDKKRRISRYIYHCTLQLSRTLWIWNAPR